MNPFVTIIAGDSAAESAFAKALDAKLRNDFGNIAEIVDTSSKPVKRMAKFTKCLIPKDLIAIMQANHLKSDEKYDLRPVVHLYLPGTRCQWLLTEIDTDLDMAFGLCDLGIGSPKLGYMSLHEVLKSTSWLMINPDFVGVAPLSEYACRAMDADQIVINWEGMPNAT
ncbi:DUF2958 domain-containing protein [Suttonella indologenes]|uniref:Protein of uncharacterized function (DUF2958) n=1 Tax=Suttonella indologenes TaxID=13276 RepID=A0A380MHN5_9GAMM|nr:DUF2958 domain-containing protein [Suttonella indologenes]SUO90249.1 Protein of uncharacterised function (DUF2958) [Suttonella indologenes]